MTEILAQHGLIGRGGLAVSELSHIFKNTDDSLSLASNYTLTGNSNHVAFTPDGQYIAVGYTISPFLTLLKRNGDKVSLASNYTLPSGVTSMSGFSPDGKYLVVCQSTAPRLILLKRDGDTLSPVGTYATVGFGYGVSFSPDGQYIGVGNSNAPYFTLLKRTGDVISLASSYALAGSGWGVSFSPDGRYIAVGNASTGPFFTLLKRSGDTVSLASTYTLPGQGSYTRFSPDGLYIAIAHAVTPFLTLLKRNGDTVSLASTYTLPGTTQGVSFSPDGEYIAVGHGVSQFFKLLKKTGDVLSLAGAYTLPGVGYGNSFSPDGQHIATSHVVTPFFTLLKRNGVVDTQSIETKPKEWLDIDTIVDISDFGLINDYNIVTVAYPKGGSITALKLGIGVEVPVIASATISLKTNTQYRLSFEMWASGNNGTDINVDLSPDTLPERNFIPTTTLQTYTWDITSADTAMGNCSLRFFNNIVIPNPVDVYITNIRLHEVEKVFEVVNPISYGSGYEAPKPLSHYMVSSNGYALTIDITSDDKYVITGDYGGVTFLKIVNDVLTLASTYEPAGIPWTIKLFPNGQYAIARLNDACILLKFTGDIVTQVASYNPGFNILETALSPNTSYIAMTYSLTGVYYVTLLKREGETITNLTTPLAITTPGSISFTPDSKYLIVPLGPDAGFKVFDVSAGTLALVSTVSASEFSEGVRILSVSPDGNKMAALVMGEAETSDPNKLFLFRLNGSTISMERMVNVDRNYGDPSFSPDGEFIFLCGGGSVLILDRRGDVVLESYIADFDYWPHGEIRFSSDGQRILLRGSLPDYIGEGPMLMSAGTGVFMAKPPTVVEYKGYRYRKIN